MNNQKGISQKTVAYIVAAFALFLMVGIVYAATTGVLTLSGSVSRGDSVDLDFTKASCDPVAVSTGVNAGEGVTVAGLAGGDFNCGVALSTGSNISNGVNDVLTWGIYLREPGDNQAITFSIINVGSSPVDLSAIDLSTSTGFGTGLGEIELTGTGTTIGQACLNPGDEIGPFTINVYWPIEDTAATGGATFTAIMDYTQAANSCQ